MQNKTKTILSQMTREEAERILKSSFGFESFHDRQWDAIHKIFHNERVLLIEKTGFGKSLCFQFPAHLFDGTTIVFSPLLALMRDQIKKLNELGITAKCINSEQTDEDNLLVINEAQQGKIKILYIAPERQENAVWLEAVNKINLSMIVVDEAHCVSVWGHDFRPAYRRIISLVRLLPAGLPVLAATATATKRVEEDIAKQIGGNISILRGNLMRENFRLYAVKVNSEDEKMIWLGQYIEKLEGNGLIYTGTRVDTEIYSRWFESLNVPAIAYNAGLDTESRKMIEKGLMENKWKCIISTNALGMGIDKADIRFIIHTQIPQSPIHYYQEIGRAGRDGKQATIILFYNPEDRRLPEAFIEGGRPSVKKYEKVIEVLKNEMLGERDLMKQTNLKLQQVRIIKSDLIEQKIIHEVIISGKKKYEVIYDAPPLNTKLFDDLRDAKKAELDNMVDYVETGSSRMKYLCDYLGDNSNAVFTNCDNTGLKKIPIKITDEWAQKLKSFKENFFPELVVESKTTNMINGIASSYYAISNVGNIIHKCKYENGGDFPDVLVQFALKAFRKKFGLKKFDLLLYVPSTVSGFLVRNFAVKISEIIKIPISHDLVKLRATKEQKIFENFALKRENVKNVFRYLNEPELPGKRILLIDDVYDSGASIKEIGRYLSGAGATEIAPLVIAKTVGGDVISE